MPLTQKLTDNLVAKARKITVQLTNPAFASNLSATDRQLLLSQYHDWRTKKAAAILNEDNDLEWVAELQARHDRFKAALTPVLLAEARQQFIEQQYSCCHDLLHHYQELGLSAEDEHYRTRFEAIDCSINSITTTPSTPEHEPTLQSIIASVNQALKGYNHAQLDIDRVECAFFILLKFQAQYQLAKLYQQQNIIDCAKEMALEAMTSYEYHSSLQVDNENGCEQMAQQQAELASLCEENAAPAVAASSSRSTQRKKRPAQAQSRDFSDLHSSDLPASKKRDGRNELTHSSPALRKPVRPRRLGLFSKSASDISTSRTASVGSHQTTSNSTSAAEHHQNFYASSIHGEVDLPSTLPSGFSPLPPSPFKAALRNLALNVLCQQLHAFGRVNHTQPASERNQMLEDLHAMLTAAEPKKINLYRSLLKATIPLLARHKPRMVVAGWDASTLDTAQYAFLLDNAALAVITKMDENNILPYLRKCVECPPENALAIARDTEAWQALAMIFEVSQPSLQK